MHELLELERNIRRSEELARMHRDLASARIDKPYALDIDEGTKSPRPTPRRTLANARLPLHVCARLGRRPPRIADRYDGGMVHLNQRDRDHVVCLAGTAKRDQRLQTTDGLALQLCLITRQRLQLDFGVSFTANQHENGAEYDFR